MGAPRKRNRYTREREKRQRSGGPAPSQGWLIGELAQLTALSVRVLRDYVGRGIISPLIRRGTQTRYGRRELLRLLALARMKSESGLTLAEAKARLNAFSSEAELEAWVRTAPVAAAAGAALGIAEPAPATATGEVDRAVERWERITLLPGLELWLSSKASPSTVRAGQRICDEYVAGANDAAGRELR